MLKLVNSQSFYKDTEPQVTILDVSPSNNGFEKKAAHEDIQVYIDKLAPKPGHTYLHILAMTAGEFYSSNRNADFFPEENLKKYYHTFETSPAYVYRAHVNKDPTKSYGRVIYAIYNERMHRVELICECPDELVQDIKARIAKGDFPSTSMAARTPADTCSICGNVSRSRDDYCQHLKYEMNKLYPDGRKVYAINSHPLTFFDISIVIKPADVNSSILQKVAEESVIGSAELAEIEGLTDDGFQKKAAFKKLSELIKEIENDCYVVNSGKSLSEMFGGAAPRDPSSSVLHGLSHLDLNQSLHALAEHGISPSISFLAELIALKKLGEGYEGIGPIVEEFMAIAPGESEVAVTKFEAPESKSVMASALLASERSGSSLFPSEVEKRASNIGYVGNGPHIEPTVEELMHMQSTGKPIPSHIDKDVLEHRAKVINDDGIWKSPVEYGKLLLTLGGMALFAKRFITSEIEKQLREKELGSQNQVKIVIVKQASDYAVTSQLAKIAMVRSVHKHHLHSNNSKNENQPQGSLGIARAGIKATKLVLRSLPYTRIGAKLDGLLRAVSIGTRVADL